MHENELHWHTDHNCDKNKHTDVKPMSRGSDEPCGAGPVRLDSRTVSVRILLSHIHIKHRSSKKRK